MTVNLLWLFILLGVLNLYMFWLMVKDKYNAIQNNKTQNQGNQRNRVNELRLLYMACMFASLGAYFGMTWLRHKSDTQKNKHFGAAFLFLIFFHTTFLLFSIKYLGWVYAWEFYLDWPI